MRSYINQDGKKYRAYNPNEFFASSEDSQEKVFNLNGVKARSINDVGQKRKAPAKKPQ
jgi:hypothetical protein